MRDCHGHHASISHLLATHRNAAGGLGQDLLAGDIERKDAERMLLGANKYPVQSLALPKW